MCLNVSSFTTPLGHSCGKQNDLCKSEQDFWHGTGLMYIFSNKNLNYILKPTVEDLQLLFGEVSLSLELIEGLGSVTHRGHLQLIICFICQEDGTLL